MVRRLKDKGYVAPPQSVEPWCFAPRRFAEKSRDWAGRKARVILA